MSKQNDLKKMTKKDLLELLVLQSKKIDELQYKLDEANELLNNKQILIAEAGSIAEASLKLNRIFEVAQESANQYLSNIERIEKEYRAKVINRKKI